MCETKLNQTTSNLIKRPIIQNQAINKVSHKVQNTSNLITIKLNNTSKQTNTTTIINQNKQHIQIIKQTAILKQNSKTYTCNYKTNPLHKSAVQT